MFTLNERPKPPYTSYGLDALLLDFDVTEADRGTVAVAPAYISPNDGRYVPEPYTVNADDYLPPVPFVPRTSPARIMNSLGTVEASIVTASQLSTLDEVRKVVDLLAKVPGVTAAPAGFDAFTAAPFQVALNGETRKYYRVSVLARDSNGKMVTDIHYASEILDEMAMYPGGSWFVNAAGKIEYDRPEPKAKPQLPKPARALFADEELYDIVDPMLGPLGQGVRLKGSGEDNINNAPAVGGFTTADRALLQRIATKLNA